MKATIFAFAILVALATAAFLDFGASASSIFPVPDEIASGLVGGTLCDEFFELGTVTCEASRVICGFSEEGDCSKISFASFVDNVNFTGNEEVTIVDIEDCMVCEVYSQVLCDAAYVFSKVGPCSSSD